MTNRATLGKSVSFEPAELDLGEVLWTTEVPFQVVLKNAGTSPVRIEKVETDCDCTIVTSAYNDHVVEPGQSFDVDSLLKTAYKSGSVIRTVRVSLDSGKNLEAYANVNVLPAYQVTPRELDFGNLDIMDNAAHERVLSFVSDYGHKVRRISHHARPWLQCRLADRQDKTEILVRAIVERMPPGRSTATLILETTDSRRPQIAIPVSACAVQASYGDVCMKVVNRRCYKVCTCNGACAIGACSINPNQCTAFSQDQWTPTDGDC